MTSLIIGVATAVVIVWLLYALSNEDRRIDELRPAVATGGPGRLGAGFVAFVSRQKLPWGLLLDEREIRYFGCSLLVSLSLLLVMPRLAFAAPVAWAVHTFSARRARRRNRETAIERALPMTVDLLRLGVGAGLNLTAALTETADHTKGPLASELHCALVEARRGRRLADALDDVVPRTSESVRPLIWSLTSTERYGAPLSEALERLARETRTDQERRAEIAARRLSIQVLFPLAGAILPAFALLTVVPLLAGSLTTLASNFG